MQIFLVTSNVKEIIYIHSIQTIEKFLRKKQLIPFLKYKPILILRVNTTITLEIFFGIIFWKKNLKIAPDDDFIKYI